MSDVCYVYVIKVLACYGKRTFKNGLNDPRGRWRLEEVVGVCVVMASKSEIPRKMENTDFYK